MIDELIKIDNGDAQNCGTGTAYEILNTKTVLNAFSKQCKKGGMRSEKELMSWDLTKHDANKV